MLFDVIEFHRTELGYFGLIYKHMRKTYYLFLFVSFPCAILLSTRLIDSLLAFLIEGTLISIVLFNLIYRSNRVVFEQYGIKKIGKFHYDRIAYEKMRASMLKDFVIQLSHSNEIEIFQRLSKKICEQAENQKNSRFLKFGFLAGGFIPLWSVMLNYRYIKNTLPWSIVWREFAFITLLLIFMQIVVVGLRDVGISIVDRNYRRLMDLKSLLDENTIR